MWPLHRGMVINSYVCARNNKQIDDIFILSPLLTVITPNTTNKIIAADIVFMTVPCGPSRHQSINSTIVPVGVERNQFKACVVHCGSYLKQIHRQLKNHFLSVVLLNASTVTFIVNTIFYRCAVVTKGISISRLFLFIISKQCIKLYLLHNVCRHILGPDHVKTSVCIDYPFIMPVYTRGTNDQWINSVGEKISDTVPLSVSKSKCKSQYFRARTFCKICFDNIVGHNWYWLSW